MVKLVTSYVKSLKVILLCFLDNHTHKHCPFFGVSIAVFVSVPLAVYFEIFQTSSFFFENVCSSSHERDADASGHGRA